LFIVGAKIKYWQLAHYSLQAEILNRVVSYPGCLIFQHVVITNKTSNSKDLKAVWVNYKNYPDTREA